MQKTARLKKLARHLLATTCLTVAAAGMANATTFNESTDFGNIFSTASVLPVGTDVVNGDIIGGAEADFEDFFEFTGLLGGSAFSLTAIANTNVNAWGPIVRLFSSSAGVLGDPNSFSLGSPVVLGGFVPGDGILIVDIGGNEGTGSYTVTLDAGQPAPEPATMVSAGLGLAGALALRRKQKA
jgi:hypothetical protein